MILLPIKPKYAFAIMNNEKKVEFRKVSFKNSDSNICVVYASSPYKKLIWYFKIKEIVEENTNKIWSRYNKIWWVNKKELDEYYEWKDKWYIIEIEEFIPFKFHISPLEIEEWFKAPQSFRYLKNQDQQKFFYNLIA